MKRTIPVCLLAAVALAGCAVGPEADSLSQAVSGALVQVTSFGSNPGGLRMWKYVPDGVSPNAPLVVALHACGQQAADYVKAGWNALADEYKFYVLYPEQTTTNNALTCFNWAGSNTNYLTGQNDPANLTRGQGENQSIKQMIDQMKSDYSIDASRVFVTGLSGGAAETVLLLAVWPDVFAAGASFAGIPYECTTNYNQVTTCLNPGVTRTPKEWGDFVRNAYPGYAGPWPRIQIWQGASDSVVNIANSTEIMKQWTDVHGIGQTATTSDMILGGKVAHAVYADASGAPVVETFKVAGMDHGVPVDPMNGCGTAAQYFLDEGFCGAYQAAVRWGIVPAAGPGDGGSVSGTGRGDGGASPVGGAGDAGGSGGGSGSGSGSGGSPSPGRTTPCSGCSASGGAAAGDAAFVLLLLLGCLRPPRRS